MGAYSVGDSVVFEGKNATVTHIRGGTEYIITFIDDVGEAPNTWLQRKVEEGLLTTRTGPSAPAIGDEESLYGIVGTVTNVSGNQVTIEITRELKSGLEVTDTHVVPVWRLELPK